MRSRVDTLWLVAVSLAVSGSFVSCRPSDSAGIRNAVFIVVDTLRRDHLGAYGYTRDTSPHIDALAAEAVRFDRAYATSGWTAPSVASMFTGVYPRVHGLVRPQTALGDDIPTLAEMLGREGFVTAGVVSHRVIGSRYGFDRGFDTFDESNIVGHAGGSTDGVTNTALAMLDALSSRDAPFFLFVHYFDPHYTYRRHVEYDFAPERVGRLRGGEEINLLRRLGPSMTDGEIAFIRDLYDGEIRYTDAGIGRLLSALEERGHYEDTLIVFSADHGEEFLERGWLGHTRTLYDELVRVPLILRLPRLPARRVIDEPVSLTSLATTILELLELEIPASLPHSSLVPHLAEKSPEAARTPVLTEVDFVPVMKLHARKTAHQESLVGPRYKLLRDLLRGKLELYDTLLDPGERDDLAVRQPELARSLERQLDDLIAEVESTAFRARELELTDEEIRELQALGYGE